MPSVARSGLTRGQALQEPTPTSARTPYKTHTQRALVYNERFIENNVGKNEQSTAQYQQPDSRIVTFVIF